MPKTEELQGVVSVDLRKEPNLPADHGTLEAAAKAFKVYNEESFAAAAEMIQTSAARIQTVESFFEADKSLAHRLHASICEKIRTITAPWRAVRPALEPKMKAFRNDQERKRQEEEARVQREQEAERQRVAQEAARIQQEADRQAAELRKQGEMKAAREVQQQAVQHAEEMAAKVDAFSDVGVILADEKPAVAGLGESRPWIGVVTDPLEIIKAVASGKIPLHFVMPRRGGGSEEIPILEVNQQVITYLAKRLGKEDIGIPGAKGERDFAFRVSKNTPVQPVQKVEEW